MNKIWEAVKRFFTETVDGDKSVHISICSSCGGVLSGVQAVCPKCGFYNSNTGK